MSQRTFFVLRAALILNMALLLLGTIRMGIVRWHHPSEIAVVQRDVLNNPPGERLISERNCSCGRHKGAASSDHVIVSSALEDVMQRHLPVGIGDDINPDAKFQVPNIVHYIWFNTAPRPLQFHHMLSVLSASKMLDPDIIYFHTNVEPIGEYWDIVKGLPNLKIMYRDPPTSLFGEQVKDPFFYTSHSNVDRVKVLMEYGGIYLDFDVLVTRPFDDLRKHVCTIGLEQDTKACGSVIVCSKRSFFLYLWINSYLDDYQIEVWAYNTGKVPYKLSRRYPHLVNVEKTRINHPNFQELDKIWGPVAFDWENNYAVHLWYRLWKDTSPLFHGVEPNPQNVKTWNGTFGEMARSILYGTKQMIDRDDFS